MNGHQLHFVMHHLSQLKAHQSKSVTSVTQLKVTVSKNGVDVQRLHGIVLVLQTVALSLVYKGSNGIILAVVCL